MNNQLIDTIWEKKVSFFGAFFLIFFFSYLFLVAIDFVPEPKDPASVVVPTDSDSAGLSDTALLDESEKFDLPLASVEEAILPTSIYIEKLDKTIPVLNPTSREVADLDAALLEGVVRHPDSATLSQDGNVFILGHSSYLPTVLNSNFKAFNGIEDLAWGDTIELVSDSSVHVYQVDRVFKARAQDVTVPVAGTGPRLTLATCNSFGSVDDRFIVEAKRVAVRSL